MPMPAAVVLIVCKVVFTPYASPLEEANARYTGHKPYKWATEHSMMQCRRLEVQLYDQSVDMGADPVPFNNFQCMKASMTERTAWDQAHRNMNWRVWRTGCPVPIKDTATGRVLSWKMPECPRENKDERVAVHCEIDTAI